MKNGSAREREVLASSLTLREITAIIQTFRSKIFHKMWCGGHCAPRIITKVGYVVQHPTCRLNQTYTFFSTSPCMILISECWTRSTSRVHLGRNRFGSVRGIGVCVWTKYTSVRAFCVGALIPKGEKVERYIVSSYPSPRILIHFVHLVLSTQGPG